MLVAAALTLATGTLVACGQAPSSDGRSEVAQGGPAFPDGSPNMPSYVGDKGGKPANVGTTNTLNLEAIDLRGILQVRPSSMSWS